MFWFAAADGAAGARRCWRSCFGWFAFRSRVTGVYLSIITQAMTYALLLAFFRNDIGFGGNNGLTDFKDILGFNVQADGTRAALFALSCLGADRRLPDLPRGRRPRKFGKVLIAVRDAEMPHAVPRLPRRDPTSCSCSRCRPAWPASPARSTCRRSASSIPANSRPAIRSRR